MMEELLRKVIEDGEWKPLRFTVYNYLEEEEYYQLHLNQNGYDSSHDDLEGKTFIVKNAVAKQFKEYVEKKLQNENPIVTICVFNDGDFFVVVKPKIVDIRTLLKMD